MGKIFVWNFKGYLWNSTQNIWPIHWKMWILFTCENFRAHKCFWNANPHPHPTPISRASNLWSGQPNFYTFIYLSQCLRSQVIMRTSLWLILTHGRTDRRMDTHTDAGNYCTQRARLASGKNGNIFLCFVKELRTRRGNILWPDDTICWRTDRRMDTHTHRCRQLLYPKGKTGLG